jgi:hypothetical protein
MVDILPIASDNFYNFPAELAQTTFADNYNSIYFSISSFKMPYFFLKSVKPSKPFDQSIFDKSVVKSSILILSSKPTNPYPKI